MGHLTQWELSEPQVSPRKLEMVLKLSLGFEWASNLWNSMLFPAAFLYKNTNCFSLNCNNNSSILLTR